jgi:type I restriction enzyme S subunit
MSFNWFGKLSSKWKVVPLREVARLGTGHTPSREVDEYWVDCTIPWVTVEDIRDHGESSLAPLTSTKQKISELGLANSAAVLHPKGTVMLSRTASIGFTCIIGIPMATTQAFVTWTPNENLLDGDYLHAALMAMGQQFYYLAYGATHLTIYFTDIKTLRIPLPSIKEQTQITALLARETAKIDALMAEQRRLMELLKEKRQAVISHAVTRGLDPHAPMKPSGIEWLGDVPEHWEISAIKRYTDKITDGAHISPETENGVFCFVSTKDVTKDSIDFDNCLRTSEQSYELMVKTGCRPALGDVLFSKDGTIGRTVVIREDRDFVVASSLIIIRPNAAILDSDFLNWLCQSQGIANQVECFVKGAGLPRLSIQNLTKVVGCFPPPIEQMEIAAYLNAESAKFDTLTTEAQCAINLLQERRTALISAAVTGQIDIRTLSEPANS